MLLSGLRTWRQLIRSRIARSAAQACRKAQRQSLGCFNVAARVEQLEGRRLLAVDFGFAVQLGGQSSDSANAIAVDSSGNVYTTGSFSLTADFDPGPDTFNLSSTGVHIADIFVSKLDSAGNFVWARSMGGTKSGEGIGIAVDASGNVYTTGRFSGTTDFDPSADTFNLTSASDAELTGADIFVSKLDSAGNFVWARSMAGDMEYGRFNTGFAIAVDSSGNVYTTGDFRGTVDFDPGAGTDYLTSAGNWDVFVSKLNSEGSYVWARRMGGSYSESSRGIAVDASGSVYTTGYFSNRLDFDPGAGIANLTASGNADIFVSKLDSEGNFAWASSMGGSSSEVGHSIALDSSGNVYTTGSFSGTADFDPGAGTANLTSSGGDDIFVSKLDSAGNFVWASSMGGSSQEAPFGDDRGLGIAVDSFGNVHTTGHFTGTADFDPGAGTNNLSSSGRVDIFVSQLDSAGNFVGASSVGGSGNDRGLGIALDSFGNVYTTGHFLTGVVDLDEAVDFDPGPGTANLTSAGATDIFVLKLVRNSHPTVDIGGPYSAPEGGAVQLDASASTDPEQDSATLSYEWDLDGDGLFGETGTTATYGDEVGINPNFSAASLDGPNSVVVSLRVTDDGGLTKTDTTSIEVVDVAPIVGVNRPAIAIVDQVITFTLSVTDPGTADLAAGYIYDISFGDGNSLSIPRAAGNAAGVPVVHEYGEPGTYLIQAIATDTNGVVGPLTTFTVFVGDATVENMNAAISETVELGGSIFLLELDTENELNLLLITIANLGDNEGATFDIVVNSNADRPNVRVTVPAGYRLILNGMTFVGGSPAFILDAGEVIVNGGTFTNNTAAPTILVNGGKLTIRNSTIEETTGGEWAAIQIMDGTVDLGTTSDAGGNTININGDGELIHNTSNSPVSAIGNTFQVDGTTLTSNFDIEDEIFHALDAGGGGLVTYVADNVYVTVNEGTPFDVDLRKLVADVATTDLSFMIETFNNGTATSLSDGYTVRFTAKDNGTATFSYTAAVSGAPIAARSVNFTVNNVAPTVVVSGPVDAVRGQTVFLSGSVTDPGVLDRHTFSVAWGDATVEGPMASRGSLHGSHIYTTAGTYSVIVTVTDNDGGQTVVSDPVVISIVAMQGDDLAVGGTTASDKIDFKQGANAGDVEVILSGVSQGIFQPTGRLLAFGQAGDDDIKVEGSIELAAWLYGDAGNDRLKGGAGHDVIFGGDGNDLLAGKNGRDLLVGGLGADRIIGNADDDILIAGYTAFDFDQNRRLRAYHERAILDIMREWTSSRDYAVRISNLTNGSGSADRENGSTYLSVNGLDATVFDDDDKDVLTGSSGFDWFFFDDDLDRATDLKDEVFASDLDFILS